MDNPNNFQREREHMSVRGRGEVDSLLFSTVCRHRSHDNSGCFAHPVLCLLVYWTNVSHDGFSPSVVYSTCFTVHNNMGGLVAMKQWSNIE